MSIQTLVKFVVALAVLVLLLTIFIVGPNALFLKLKDLVPKVDEGSTRNYYENDPEALLQLQKTQEAFSEFASAYKRLANAELEGNICFIQVNSKNLRELLKNHRIEITYHQQEQRTTLWLRKIIKEDGEFTYENTPMPVINLPDIKPCIVYGSGEQDRLYDNYINLDSSVSTGYSEFGTQTEKIILEKDKLTETHFGNNRIEELDWKTLDNSNYVLLRTGEHICLIPTTGDYGHECKAKNNLITDHCFRKSNDKSIYNNAKFREYTWSATGEQCHPPAPEAENLIPEQTN